MEFINQLFKDIQKINLGDIFTASSLFTTVLLVAGTLFLRRLLIRYVWRDSEILDKDQRRWIIRIKNGSVIVMIVGLILIWAPQLHTFALSITAFTVALVVATKEMILCLTGAIMRVTSQPFKAGDWVTVDGVMGEVVDLDAFAFRLQEVDVKGKSYHFTGRTVVIPNSKLFSSNVENANFFKSFIFDDIKITVQFADIDTEAAMSALQKTVEKHFAPYRTEAQVFNRKIRRRAGIAIGLAEPVYDLATSDIGHYHFMVRLFLPTVAASNVRGDITRDFLAYVYKQRKLATAKKDAPQVQPEKKEAAEAE